jgi:hypothetical protein
MKARRNATAPTKVPPTHQSGLEASQHKKLLNGITPESIENKGRMDFDGREQGGSTKDRIPKQNRTPFNDRLSYQ